MYYIYLKEKNVVAEHYEKPQLHNYRQSNMAGFAFDEGLFQNDTNKWIANMRGRKEFELASGEYVIPWIDQQRVIEDKDFKFVAGKIVILYDDDKEVEPLCRHCEHWKPCMLFPNNSHVMICTNEKVFIKKPSTLSQVIEFFSADFSGVYTKDETHSSHRSDPIATGENFGCIHFEKRKRK